MKHKTKARDKVQFCIIIGIFLGIVLACVISIWRNEMIVKAEDNFKELERQVSVTVPIGNKGNPKVKGCENCENSKFTIKHNVSVLSEKNKDCIGWLSIGGTEVSYPVMQSKEEHQKYLSKDFNGNYSLSGTPFLDYRCSLNGENMIIYGHHMNDGGMFGTLMNYTRQTYRDAYPNITFETKNGIRKYTVFSVIKTTSKDEWYKFIDAESAEKFCKRVAYANEHSIYNTGIKPSMSHKLLTLSTCTNESEEERLIVIAYEN